MMMMMMFFRMYADITAPPPTQKAKKFIVPEVKHEKMIFISPLLLLSQKKNYRKLNFM
jgi:hypothetical protein